MKDILKIIIFSILSYIVYQISTIEGLIMLKVAITAITTLVGIWVAEDLF